MVRVLALFAGLYLLLVTGLPTVAQERPTVVLKGEYDCKSGKVRVMQEFGDLQSAGVTLKQRFSREGVDALLGSLAVICESQPSSEGKSGATGKPIAKDTASLIASKKEGDLVTFQVYDFSNFSQPSTALRKVFCRRHGGSRWRPLQAHIQRLHDVSGRMDLLFESRVTKGVGGEMPSNKTTILVGVMSSAVVAAAVTLVGNARLETYRAEQNRQLEKYKVDLQNENAALNKRISAISTLAERFNGFADELNNYIRVLQIVSRNRPTSSLVQESRRSWSGLAEKMADLNDARKQDSIDHELSEEIDGNLLVPANRNLAAVQRHASQNPDLTALFSAKLGREILEIKKKIKAAAAKLTL